MSPLIIYIYRALCALCAGACALNIQLIAALWMASDVIAWCIMPDVASVQIMCSLRHTVYHGFWGHLIVCSHRLHVSYMGSGGARSCVASDTTSGTWVQGGLFYCWVQGASALKVCSWHNTDLLIIFIIRDSLVGTSSHPRYVPPLL